MKIIKEMQIKSTVSYRLPLIRLAHLLSQKQEISAGEDVEEKWLNSCPLLVGTQIAAATMDSNIENPQRLKIELNN